MIRIFLSHRWLSKKSPKLAITTPGKGPIESRNQTALNQSKKGKTLEDSFGLLFDLVGELIDIRDLDVVGHPILTTLYENIQDFDEVTFGKMTLGTLYHLLLYLEEDIQ